MADTPSPRGVLASLSASHLNCHVPSSKKRKYVEDEEHLQLRAFLARLLPGEHGEASFTLIPVARLDRSQLRLAHLDFTPPAASLPSGCSFRAEIPLFGGHPARHRDSLLVARVAPEGGLYVVERVGDSTYTACRLRACLDDYYSRAAVDDGAVNGSLPKLPEFKPQVPVSRILHHPVTDESRKSQSVAAQPKRPKNRKGALARLSILPKAESPQTSIQQQEPDSIHGMHAAPVDCQRSEHTQGDSQLSSYLPANINGGVSCEEEQSFATVHVADEPEAVGHLALSADELLECVQEVLLKNLYTSTVPLAHFTKSTLARTRATFRSSAVTKTSELADFYRGRILPSKKLDLKYRDTIPNIIEDMVLPKSLGESGMNGPSKVLKKKPAKTRKPGKGGLFAGEEEYIRAWWFSRDQDSQEIPTAHSRKEEMCKRLKELRNRETQLQIVLIFEILALESNVDTDRERNGTPLLLKQDPEDDGGRNCVAEEASTRKKRRDVKSDLDLLVDRLCIYQSVNIADPVVPEDTRQEQGRSSGGLTDQLREFCFNVIIPFYSHKVPALVKEVSRKLVGPSMSPKRPKMSARAASCPQAKSTTAVDPRRRAIRQQTLKRVLSEEHITRHSSPPTLIRSVTTPSGGMGKGSSPEISQRPSSRGSLHRSQSFTNREIDLVANSKAEEAKRRKLASLAKQKDELSTAIHALKKPNRSLVGLQIMKEAEQRGAEGALAGRGVRSGLAMNQGPGVQIAATPKKGRPSSYYVHEGYQAAEKSTSEGSSARTMRKKLNLPSIGVEGLDHGRGPSLNQLPKSTEPRQPTYPAIQETPSRGSSKTCNPLDLPTTTTCHSRRPQSSPSGLLPPLHQTNHLTVHSTPSTNRFQPKPANLSIIENTPLRMSKCQKAVLFTPLDPTDVGMDGAFRDAPLVPEEAGKAMERVMKGGAGGNSGRQGNEKSIYESLGWDDDVDELL